MKVLFLLSLLLVSQFSFGVEVPKSKTILFEVYMVPNLRTVRMVYSNWDMYGYLGRTSREREAFAASTSFGVDLDGDSLIQDDEILKVNANVKAVGDAGMLVGTFQAKIDCSDGVETEAVYSLVVISNPGDKVKILYRDTSGKLLSDDKWGPPLSTGNTRIAWFIEGFCRN